MPLPPIHADSAKAPHACRPGCGACCIAPSISSPIPGMPVINGISKPAGVRCIQLSSDNRCLIFGHPDRPQVCWSLQPTPEMCGDSREQALRWLGVMERDTQPRSDGGVVLGSKQKRSG